MADIAVDSTQRAALPLHVQRLQHLLNISPLLNHIEKVFADFESDCGSRYVYVYVRLAVMVHMIRTYSVHIHVQCVPQSP